MDIGTPEEEPTDKYSEVRSQVENRAARPIVGIRVDPVKRFFEASLGKPTHILESRTKYQQFLANDRKVLKFWCQWDESEARPMYADIHSFVEFLSVSLPLCLTSAVRPVSLFCDSLIHRS